MADADQEDPTVEPSADLAEVIRLAGVLEDEVGWHATDRLMPGGEQLAAVAPARLPRGHDMELVPLQILLLWTEPYRAERNSKPASHPTLESEARWLRTSLSWANERHKPEFKDLAADVRDVRRHLEALTREGQRQTPGIQCPRCRKAAMVRTEHNRSKPRGCHGHGALQLCPVRRCNCADRGGLIDEWVCPECKHKLRQPDYDAAVFKDYIGHAPYLPGKYVERRTGVPYATVRVWAHRGHVHTQRDAREEVTYCIADIVVRHALLNANPA